MKVYNVNGRIETTMTLEEYAKLTYVIKDVASTGKYDYLIDLNEIAEKLLNPQVIVE